MIEIKDIYKTYSLGQIEVKALDGVSLKISSGEFVAIMGASGSGKSTLMHILGLLDRPDTGSYFLGDREITRLTDETLAALRNRVMGFVFQQFHLLPRMTALENAELPLIYAGKRHLAEKARQEIAGVGLQDRLRHRPSELSGGQQQRAAIARALVNDPLIILADEPTGNLDSKSKEEIISILKNLNQKGKTLIIVTHEKEVAMHARRVIQMRDGRIISDQRMDQERMLSEVVALEDGLLDTILAKPRKAAGQTKFLDYLRQAVSAMLSHKMRSLLSILGILIGVASVIAMLALGQGAKESIEKQVASLGSNLLLIRPGSTRSQGVALQAGTVTRFTFSDLAAISKLTDEVVRAYPSVTGRGQIVHADKNWNTQVEGVGVPYAQMRAAIPAAGRFFNEQEVRLREKVALLGMTVARELFGDANPVGETIKINLVNFRVIGVLPEKGASAFRDQDDIVIIPVTTAMYRVLGRQYIDSIFVEAKAPELLQPAQEAISALIRKEHRLDEDDNDSFQIRNMADIKNTLEATTKTMSLLLGSIAAISLLVGGIGIMNIMLVSVTERTREIGLRKAIGANNRDILAQFLIESVLMALIGGLSGIFLGGGVSLLINIFAGWAVRVSPFSVALAAIFSLVIGVAFGIWPAHKASRLDPIEALRYE
ncbi:MAG: MacB family efflux pump subunit [Omnitrophica WOR_2 bacterium RIFCSPLOWO2_12_FULL_51_8]|nr:MAG: MacB family efflux pump subunit [Omnitrophica WOR_2 bacterium RIFCSPLOWO2_12_FULL_51_8]